MSASVRPADTSAAQSAAARVPTLALHRADPTGTAPIRREWIDDFDARWLAAIERVETTLTEHDAFGLTRSRTDSGSRRGARAHHPRFTGTDGAKLAQFHDWLATVLEQTVLEPTTAPRITRGEHWTGEYIRRVEFGGMAHGEQVLRAIGVEIPDAEAITPDRVFSPQTPIRGTGPISREQWLYETYQEVRGHVDLVVQRATRAVGDALSSARTSATTEAVTPRALASAAIDRLDKLGQTRTQQLVSGFVVELHNNAALSRYQLAGISQVVGVAEGDDASAGSDLRTNASAVSLRANISLGQLSGLVESTVERAVSIAEGGYEVQLATAGDDRVCSECAGLEGAIYSLSAAYSELPLHLGCRCFFLPVYTDYDL